MVRIDHQIRDLELTNAWWGFETFGGPFLGMLYWLQYSWWII